MKQICTVASSRSYGSTGFEAYQKEHTYNMITKCFHGNPNLTIVANCEQPEIYNFNDNIPVTSLLTGYIYWNNACAACNDDALDVREWVPNIMIKTIVPYFSNKSARQLPFPDTYERLLTYIQSPRLSDIIYTPPEDLSTEDKVCIRKDSFHVKYCERSPNMEALSTIDWLYESCRRLFNPVQLLDGDTYRNIFCLVCRRTLHLTSSDQRCSHGDGRAALAGYITAMLNYKAEPVTMASTENDPLHVLAEGSCGCTEIFDLFLVNT